MNPEGYAQRSSTVLLSSPSDHYVGSRSLKLPRRMTSDLMAVDPETFKQHRCLIITQAAI
jgi:hypothetical protein